MITLGTESPQIRKLIGYGRRSKDTQRITPEVQQQVIQEAIDKGRWGKEGEDFQYLGFFCDDETSKIDLLDRPVGQQLMVFADRGDLVIGAKFDRLFRSPGDCEKTLDRFRFCGISLCMLDFDIDTSTPAGQMMAGVMASFARYERDQIGIRTQDALRLKWLRCEPVGSSKPFGYKAIGRKGERRFTPCQYQRRRAMYYLQKIREGMCKETLYKHCRKIYRELNFPTRSAVDGEFRIREAAARACLDFPIYSREELNMLVKGIGWEMTFYTESFIRSDEELHERAKEAIAGYQRTPEMFSYFRSKKR